MRNSFKPRRVWWTNPSPVTGAWQSRWWISSPLDADRLSEIAVAKAADYLIFYGVSVPRGFAQAQTLTQKIEVSVVNVDVVVTGPDGAPVRGLTRDDFHEVLRMK